MFREMRRKNQLLSDEETSDILKNGSSGVLALLCDEGYPYTVPMSYVYFDNRIFFHSAASGQKIDAIKSCEKASFCVINEDKIIPEKFTTLFKSAVVFGKIKIIEDGELKLTALRNLARKYSPNENSCDEIAKGVNSVCIIELEIEKATGKQAAELANKKI